MKKRTLAVLVAAVMLLTSVLSGCGDAPASSGGASSTTGGASSAASTPADDPSSTASTSSTATGDDVKLAAEGITTEVGTPREQTLIVEVQNGTDTPGQFNTYMKGTSKGIGIHQMMSACLWEMDTVSGNQFGEVAESVESNADFTEHTVKIRQGIKWSDGEDLTAEDVAFTFNMIRDNPNIGASTYANQIFKSIEAVDDYTVKFTMNESFPRLAQKFGVTIYGTDYLIVPEHIYSQQADVSTFKDEQPVVAGPYTVKEYDPLGKWVLYELREDWMQSTLGVAGAAQYGYTEENAPAKYAWFRTLGDQTTKQMAMINNEVDILCEVTPEMLTVMNESNPNISAWYKEFPYATSDDPCSKGIAFSIGKGAPYDDPNFRWGIALALDFDQISMNVFDGVGRASPFPILTATSAMMEFYYEPMLDWVTNFELDLGDGTKFKPFDPDYKYRIAEALRAKGYDIPDDEETLTDMFGIGWWKHDEEAATKLLNKAGLEKVDGVWQFNGQPFKFNMSYLADSEEQAGRGTQAAFNQLQAFGFDCSISTESSATWSTNGSTGNYEISGYWPTGGIVKDIYNQINGYANDLIVPLGESGSGQGTRWDNQEATDIIKKMAVLDPASEENYELGIEFMKIAIEEMPFIAFHSGVKFVPTNSTYWSNYPCADNPYNGPWWWWSCFKYIAAQIEPVPAA